MFVNDTDSIRGFVRKPPPPLRLTVELNASYDPSLPLTFRNFKHLYTILSPLRQYPLHNNGLNNGPPPRY
jgi:hypothetical protein